DGKTRQDVHERIEFNNIDVEPLSVQHALTDGKQPAHIGIQRQNLAQHYRYNEHEGEDKPRQARQPLAICRMAKGNASSGSYFRSHETVLRANRVKLARER